ncbi:cytochrome P450 [Amycolatopsis echigonensis]|uniref:Cytochrome P450 n=1 Tax=Amycolatopsis echigonensis TaxID=2576905 RepID=A0A2N3WUS5_9PSEU|nr:cytochrome P450 [Amycolatopsis niigatensis]PKV97605.1 cytochrome P450 [Amycolatopsis niigatensis]
MTDVETPLPPVFARRDGFDPLPELERLRDERPVTKVDHHWGVETWLVTRYDDVRMILGDHKRFTSAPPPYFATADGEDGVEGTGWFIVYNPPAHTRLRRMLAAEFTKRRLARLEPRIEETVAAHLDEMERGGRSGHGAELVSQFALRLPMVVICELFGVSLESRTELLPLSSKFTDFSLPVEERRAASERAGAIMVEFVREQRANPGEGMLGMLIREHGDDLTDRELAGVADLMVQAGYETTMSMLSLGTLVLLRHPEHVPLLFAGERERDQVVEELLRYLSITHNLFPRVAQEDVTISGQLVRAGELLMCSPPLANRDERLGKDLDRFDPGRDPSGHLAFGHGIHHCIGAPLARLELQMALPALFRRFPGLRLAVPFEDIAWRPNANFYGLDALPVAW